MNTSDSRLLPIGIQSFEKLRSEGFLYADKTALVYKLAKSRIPYFLSRPRRFGKSLLLTYSGRFETVIQKAYEKTERLLYRTQKCRPMVAVRLHHRRYQVCTDGLSKSN